MTPGDVLYHVLRRVWVEVLYKTRSGWVCRHGGRKFVTSGFWLREK